MKAISIRQPWAWLIVSGHKDIENRSWPTRYRGRILIQAGGRIAADAEYAYQIAAALRIRIPQDLPLGAIVGAVDIVDCVTTSRSRWFGGPYGFVLAHAMQVVPMPCKSALGLFEVAITENELVKMKK